MAKLTITLGKNGRRCGESHGRAKLADHEIELIHTLAAGGMGNPEIARKFDITREHVWRIVNGYRHSITPEDVRVVEVVIRKRRKRLP